MRTVIYTTRFLRLEKEKKRKKRERSCLFCDYYTSLL